MHRAHQGNEQSRGPGPSRGQNGDDRAGESDEVPVPEELGEARIATWISLSGCVQPDSPTGETGRGDHSKERGKEDERRVARRDADEEHRRGRKECDRSAQAQEPAATKHVQ